MSHQPCRFLPDNAVQPGTVPTYRNVSYSPKSWSAPYIVASAMTMSVHVSSSTRNALGSASSSSIILWHSPLMQVGFRLAGSGPITTRRSSETVCGHRFIFCTSHFRTKLTPAAGDLVGASPLDACPTPAPLHRFSSSSSLPGISSSLLSCALSSSSPEHPPAAYSTHTLLLWWKPH